MKHEAHEVHNARSILQSLKLPERDAYDLPTSSKRFADGAAYRVEIPSCEGPKALRAVIEEAAARKIRVHRISQGSGIMLQTDDEIREMLALGQEHGKSLILSTHLLGDVERVCETVVILHAGEIKLQGHVRDLRRMRQDRYILRIQGDPTAFVEELRLEGVQVVHDNGRGELRLAAPAGWTTRAFFVLADNTGVLIRGLERDDEDLEELFHRVIGTEK